MSTTQQTGKRNPFLHYGDLVVLWCEDPSADFNLPLETPSPNDDDEPQPTTSGADARDSAKQSSDNSSNGSSVRSRSTEQCGYLCRQGALVSTLGITRARYDEPPRRGMRESVFRICRPYAYAAKQEYDDYLHRYVRTHICLSSSLHLSRSPSRSQRVFSLLFVSRSWRLP